jgi:hypothetical protein
MRDNYERFGVDGYYKDQSVAHSYRNPHYDGIVDTTIHLLNQWYNCHPTPPSRLYLLDVACGSGEATLAAHQWLSHNRTTSPRDDTATILNVNGQWKPAPRPARVCRRPRIPGISPEFQMTVSACDPFTFDAYHARTGLDANRYSFADIANGCLTSNDNDDDQDNNNSVYDVCIFSFAAHLIDSSMLFGVFYQLALCSRHLMILSPHKRPLINESMGWQLMEEMVGEQRVHGRLFKSLLMES